MSRTSHGWPVLFLCFAILISGLSSCSRHLNPRDVRMSTAISTDPRFGTSIYGIVADDHGAPLPGVSVLLESDRNTSLAVTTSPSGGFFFRNLPAGIYNVNFSIEGFTEVRQEAVRVLAGSQVQLGITLKPTLSEEFTVIGETPIVDTKRSGGQVTTLGPGQGQGLTDPGVSGSMGSGNIIPQSMPSGRKHAKHASPPAAPSISSDATQLVVIAQDDEWSEPPLDQPSRNAGMLIARKTNADALGVFPLKHTEIAARISGFLGQTTVEQEFTNPYQEVIEAEYVFPLPSLSAVNDFVMDTGRNRIIGVVRPRKEAEAIYRNALESGMTASLLTQVRPNIFDQKIANIEPGASVKITITYSERLFYENGFYQYVFPMVVAPRFGAASPQDGELQRQNDDDAFSCSCPVSDDEAQPLRVMHTGQDVGLTIQLDAGMPIAQLLSDTHQIEVQEKGKTRRTIRLAQGAIPNRDFALRWSVAGENTQFGVLAHKQGDDGFFSVMIQPPLQPSNNQVNPREITFIMDISGSMSGVPVETSRALVEKALDQMRPQDLFNIVYFSGGNNQLWDKAQPATPDSVAKAKTFLQSLSGGGGTEMMAALNRALTAVHDSRYLQMYVFLTDGQVVEENEILRTVQQNQRGARFFAFGIGSSVNRHLIDGIGESGGGFAQVVYPQNPQLQAAANRFFAAIDSPVLVDARINWNGLPVKDVYPKKLHDLFAGQTLSLVGKYDAPVSGKIYVEGTLGGVSVQYEVPLELPAEEVSHEVLATLWARQRIHELTSRMLTAESDKKKELEEKITSVALSYHLESDYTSFVAVDESRVVGAGKPLHILQPLEKPLGTSTASLATIPAWGLSLHRTADGKVVVQDVDRKGIAAQSGIREGAVLLAVNNASVYSLDQLEELLLQSGDQNVQLDFQKQGAVVMPAP